MRSTGYALACSFQLVGLACLRAAMGDHVADLPQYPKREAASSVAKDDMDAQRFAHISDLTYSAEQVSLECTAACV